MSYRDRPGGKPMPDLLQEVLDRLRKLENLEWAKGRVSMGAVLLGNDLHLSAILDDQGNEVLRVERRSTGDACIFDPGNCEFTEADLTEDIVFSLGGSLRTVSSSRYYAKKTGTAGPASVSLDVSGTTPTTVELRKNGGVVATLVVPANSTGPVEDTGARARLTKGVDYLTVAVTTAGSGAQGATVQVDFVPDAAE